MSEIETWVRIAAAGLLIVVSIAFIVRATNREWRLRWEWYEWHFGKDQIAGLNWTQAETGRKLGLLKPRPGLREMVPWREFPGIAEMRRRERDGA